VETIAAPSQQGGKASHHTRAINKATYTQVNKFKFFRSVLLFSFNLFKVSFTLYVKWKGNYELWIGEDVKENYDYLSYDNFIEEMKKITKEFQSGFAVSG
jgi:hypothetical protein